MLCFTDDLPMVDNITTEENLDCNFFKQLLFRPLALQIIFLLQKNIVESR